MPLLIITGQNDQITPKEMAEELYETAIVEQKSLTIIENGGHNDLPVKAEYKKVLNEFFSRNYAYLSGQNE
jgi:fermentation-respiration switch protein FrsA (DUF1100 family)